MKFKRSKNQSKNYKLGNLKFKIPINNKLVKLLCLLNSHSRKFLNSRNNKNNKIGSNNNNNNKDKVNNNNDKYDL